MIPTPILDELQALLEKATPGPWTGGSMYLCQRRDDGSYYEIAQCPDGMEDAPEWEANWLATTQLRNHAPALIAAARQLEEVRRDGERLQLIEDECLDVRCYSRPTGGDDYSTGWEVSEHPTGEDEVRVIGQYPDNLRKALDLAAAQLGDSNGQ